MSTGPPRCRSRAPTRRPAPATPAAPVPAGATAAPTAPAAPDVAVGPSDPAAARPPAVPVRPADPAAARQRPPAGARSGWPPARAPAAAPAVPASGGPRPGGGPGGPGARPGGSRSGGGPGPGGARWSAVAGPAVPAGSAVPAAARSRRRRRDLDELQPQYTNYTRSDAPVPEGTIVIERGVSAQEFAPKLNRTSADVVRFLLNNGEMVTATMTSPTSRWSCSPSRSAPTSCSSSPASRRRSSSRRCSTTATTRSNQQPRPPVITVMGHVDHGKTTLLDKIRNANVVAGEAGGITQHIGAYQVEQNGDKITFLDTPGHAAFTQMRARGAEATDIVVLVVAADDGVMPQTIEAINHAKAAEVPIIVAREQDRQGQRRPAARALASSPSTSWCPRRGAATRSSSRCRRPRTLGIDDLLDQLLVVAELEELDRQPDRPGQGRRARGQPRRRSRPGRHGARRQGRAQGRRPDRRRRGVGPGPGDDRRPGRAGQDGRSVDARSRCSVCRPCPQAGDEFRAAPDEKTARIVAEAREQRQRLTSQRGDARVKPGAKLEDIFAQIQSGETATLNLVLKADVHGSLEAVTESLRRLDRHEVKLTFVHRAVGGITENDIRLAATTNATIIGFNVRPDRKARELADAEGVEIRTYEIIYKLLEDIEQAMVGMLAPEFEEVVTGEAEVREIFRVPRIGAIAGCYVRSGVITRGSKVRFLRDGTIIWKGEITSLQALQGRRPRGPRGLRVRHRPVRLPGPQAGRPHRDLRRAGDRRGPDGPLHPSVRDRRSRHPRTTRAPVLAVTVLPHARPPLSPFRTRRADAARGDRR